MDLPQTAPGVPAPGVDPTVDELAAITSVPAIFAWLGTAESIVAAFMQSLGGASTKNRDVVYISAGDYEHAIAGFFW